MEASPVLGREPGSACGHALPGLFSSPERSPFPRRFSGERICVASGATGKLAAAGKKTENSPTACPGAAPPSSSSSSSSWCDEFAVLCQLGYFSVGCSGLWRGCPLPSAAATERLRSESLPSPPGDLWLGAW